LKPLRLGIHHFFYLFPKKQKKIEYFVSIGANYCKTNVDIHTFAESNFVNPNPNKSTDTLNLFINLYPSQKHFFSLNWSVGIETKITKQTKAKFSIVFQKGLGNYFTGDYLLTGYNNKISSTFLNRFDYFGINIEINYKLLFRKKSKITEDDSKN
jgi:hypothetical protein